MAAAGGAGAGRGERSQSAEVRMAGVDSWGFLHKLAIAQFAKTRRAELGNAKPGSMRNAEPCGPRQACKLHPFHFMAPVRRFTMLRTACQGSYCLVAASHPQPAKLTPRQRRLQKQRNQWKQQRQQQQTAPPPPPPPRSPPPPPERRLHQGLGTPDAATLQLECPHFDSCSGCTLDKQLERPPVLEDAERFFEETGLVHFKLHTGRSQRWRRRARLAVRQGPGGEPAIGLFEEGSHTVTPIPACT